MRYPETAVAVVVVVAAVAMASAAAVVVKGAADQRPQPSVRPVI
jgi:hypothetical protein